MKKWVWIVNLIVFTLIIHPSRGWTQIFEARLRVQNNTSKEEILKRENLVKIKEFILQYGKRETYGSKYNNNPAYMSANYHFYLNPDIGQQNINCDLNKSGFQNMTIRATNRINKNQYRHIEFAENNEISILVTSPTNDLTVAELRDVVVDAMKEILVEIDTVVIKNPDKISDDILVKARLIELGPKDRNFSKEEVEIVTNFVKQGGSILLLTDEEVRTPLLPDGMNAIMSRFGMKFSNDTEYLHNCGAYAKAGEINALDREVAYSGGRSIEGGTAFAWRLNENGDNAEHYASYVKLEQGGRVVALSEGMAALGMGTAEGKRLSGVPRNPQKTIYWGKDSKIFMKEIREWLMKK